MSGDKHENKITICLTDEDNDKVRHLAKKVKMNVSVFLFKAAINGIPTVLANKMSRRYELEDMEVE